jgi:predicted peptidase
LKIWRISITISQYLVCLVISSALLLGCSGRLNWLTEDNNKLKEIRLKQKVQHDLKINFLLYLPSAFNDSERKWPLMIFLHGRGEQGDDLEKVKVHGPPRRINEGAEFPFILAAPQCPLDEWWSVTELDHWLEFLLSELPVDPHRIYLTGLSMGGFGTWSWAIDQPERFAAIAPVCGGGESRLVWRLKDIPVWVFHGAKDTVVPLERSQEMVDALKEIGGNIKFTIYPEAGHDSWTETYNNPEFYNWLLKQKK